MKDDNEPAKTPSPPKAGSWMPSSGLRPPPTRRILFGGEGFGSCVREESSNGLMPRDGKSPCPPRHQVNSAVARPTALRPLPLSAGTFRAHTGPDWTTLPGVGGAVSGRPSARGPCPRRLPRRLRPGLLPALRAWRPLGSGWRSRTSGPTPEYLPCIPGSSAQGSGMGRLFTNWRSLRHASRPKPCRKSSPSAWRSVQQTATPHPGCEGLRLPCGQRRIWPWSPGLWQPFTGALPCRGEAQAHRRTCRPEPSCTSGMRPQRRTTGRSRRWRPCRGQCGSGLGRPPPSGTVTSAVRGASGSTAPRLDSPDGSVNQPRLMQGPGWNSSGSTAKRRESDLTSPFSKGGPPSARMPSAACSATPSGLMLAGMLSGGEVPRHAGCASPPPSTSSSRGGGLAYVQPWVTPWGFEIQRLWVTWCYRMLTRLWAWGHAVRFYLRLCGVWLCTTSHGLRSLRWNRRTRAHRLFLGMLAAVWWRTSRKSRASPTLPLTTPSRARPRPSQNLYQSHDRPPLPRPPPSPPLLSCPLRSSSCPTLTRMRMSEMGRGFVGLWSVCQIWGALLLRQMPSGLERPALGGLSPVSDPGNQGHGGSSTPPPPVRQHRVPSPSRVGGPDAVVPTIRQQRLVPKRRSPEVTECPPRKRPAVGQGLAPGRGVSVATGGNGGGGALAPGLRDEPRPPTGSKGGAGSSARQRLGAVAVGCEASNAAPSAPPRTSGGGRARLWAVRKFVEGSGRWSWRWRLAVAGEQRSEQVVDVGQPPRGVGASYSRRPPGEKSTTMEELRTRGTVVLAPAEGLGVRGGGVGGGPPP